MKILKILIISSVLLCLNACVLGLGGKPKFSPYVWFDNQCGEPVYIAWIIASSLSEPISAKMVFESDTIELRKVEDGERMVTDKKIVYDENFSRDLEDLQLIVFRQSTLDTYSREEIIAENINDGIYVMDVAGAEIIYGAVINDPRVLIIDNPRQP